MAVNSYDSTNGRPIFVDTDAPDIKVDPTEAAKFAADVGNRIVRADLAGLNSYTYKRAGLAGHALDTKTDYVHDGSGWVRVQRVQAEAAGVATVAAATTTVNFPVGRFTVAPVITGLTPIHPSNVVVARLLQGSVTTTKFDVQIFTIGGAIVAGDVHWHAVQMTPSTAAG